MRVQLLCAARYTMKLAALCQLVLLAAACATAHSGPGATVTHTLNVDKWKKPEFCGQV